MMKHLVTVLVAGALAIRAQEPPPPDTAQPPPRTVAIDMTDQVAEAVQWKMLQASAGTSPIDTARALEDFLRRFPDTERRLEIERTLAESAIEERDRVRIIRYGEAVLAREPHNLRLVEFVTRALLNDDDPENAKKALGYAMQLENDLRLLELQQPDGASQRADLKVRIDEGISRALTFRSRALGNLERFDDAVKIARAGYERKPSAESAREAGRWLARMGRDEEAIQAYADAFAINDPEVSTKLRAGDRKRLSELYLKSHDSEDGLGDLILAAWDRTTAAIEARNAKLKQIDPNFDAAAPLEFTISGLDGETLAMESLRGKVVVLDFWATWCKPCLVQQPLYAEVENKYADRTDVVFLYLNADRLRSVVAPFLKQHKWENNVYFEDGLQRFFNIGNIPTTVIIDKKGKIASKMLGFKPELFVEMLSERIERALAED